MSNRNEKRLNSKLEKNLAAYFATAGAVGVGVLAATMPAEGKIVYTPTNTVINSSAVIDLNHDGIADFVVGFHVLDKSLVLAVTPEVLGNEIRLGSKGGAAAGFFGVPVGPGENFAATTGGYSWGPFMAVAGGYSGTGFLGPWANTTNRYLGLKFLINGQVHYGWARMSVNKQVVLTGFAYETIPNTNILEGHTSGPEKAGNFAPADLLTPAQSPATLGMLARGADTVSIWRREEETVSN